MRRAVLHPMLCLVVVHVAHAQQAPAVPAAWRDAIAAFEERLAADVAADDVGSIMAGIAVDGRLVWWRGFGWADRDRRIAPDTATLYRIGSISKSVTAVALAQLAARGDVSLDDPVERWLPEVRGFTGARDGAAPITLRQLASHTAGIIREPRLNGAASGPITEWEQKLLASIPATSFDTLPGARYAYSNIGYGVLGLAVSRAAGMPFMELVERRIFEPLGMRSSTFVAGAVAAPRVAIGYANSAARIDAETPAREHDGRGYKVPNGGIYSNLPDLARFAGAMSGVTADVPFDGRMRGEVLRVQTPGNPGNGYGLGFTIRVLEDGGRVAGHGGSVAGYTAHLVFDPDRRIAVIVLRNYNQGRTNLGSVATSLLLQLRN